IVDEDDTVTRRIIEIDVLGVITGTKLALRRMLPRGRGHIINIASLAGELPCPGLSTYCGAKHAVLGFTDSVRKEVRGTGVHVSSVLPTLTNTQLTSGTSGMKGFREVQPEEIAEAIVGLMTKPRPRVRITRVSGLLVQAQGFFPRRPYEALSRLFGVETQFLGDVDNAARAAYEERARAS
ncbi:MAG: SDR family NAD(P)-dependent oxidoreductase, partial [Rhodococcus sp. (in: high G+C Gram-positive bacteria)]